MGSTGSESAVNTSEQWQGGEECVSPGVGMQAWESRGHRVLTVNHK